jgi:hypothetical protein
MKGEFTDGLGQIRSGEITGRRKERRPGEGFKDVIVDDFDPKNESKIPAFVRIRLKNGTEVEVHPSRVR